MGATDEVAVKVSADTADFEGGAKRTVSGLDSMAESSGRLKTALASTTALTHDVDALFKQISGSSKTMSDAAKSLNQAFREGIVPVDQLNQLSERLQGHFSGLANSAKQVKTEIREIGAAEALAPINDNARRVGEAMGHVGSMTVGAKREMIVLAHEAMSGNFSRMPGSLMVLAERFGNVGMAALRVVAPLAAVGFVAYEIAAHNEHAAQALAKIANALVMSGQAGLFTRDGMEATIQSLSRMHGIGTEAAQGITTEFARIRSVTPQVMADLSRGMEGWILLTGQEGPAAAEKLAKSMADPEKMLEELDRQTNRVSADTKQLVADLVDAGDIMGAKAAVAREFGDEMEAAAGRLKTPLQQAAQDAGNALNDLAHAFSGAGEHGQGTAAALRTLAEVIRSCEVPMAILGKALRDLMDMVTMVVQAAMAGFAGMKTVAEVAAVAVFEFARMVKQAIGGDLAEAEKTALEMPGKLAREWSLRAAEVKRHLDEIRAAMRDIAEPYLPGSKVEGHAAPAPAPTSTPGATGGENGNDRDKRVLDILDRTLTVQRELRRIEGDKMVLTEQMALLQNQMAAAPDSERGKLQAQIADIKEAIRLKNEQAAALRKKDGGESEMEGYRRELAEIQAADRRSLEERKAEDLKFWQAKRAHLAEGSKEYAQVTMEIRRLEKAIDADSHAELLAKLERDRAAAQKGSEQRIAIARAEAEEVKRYAGEHSKAYQDALARIAEMEREHQKELNRINADGIEARAATAKADLEIHGENLRFLRDMGALDNQDALARLREVKAQEYQIERNALEEKLRLKNLETSERDRLNKQLAQVDQTYRAQDLAASHQQTLATLRDWQTTASGIGSVMGNAFKGLIIQGQSFQQFERNMALGLANVFADLAMKRVGSWIWSEGVMRVWSKITGQQEVIDTATKEAAKTGAVTAGQAARTSATVAGTGARAAAEGVEQGSFLARIGEQIASWLGLETSKTAETMAQAAARSGAESASTIAAIAAAKAEAAGEIPAFAAIAGAAAMASVSCIPFVGWAMAPEVGEETYAMAMSFLPMASAEGGWEHVPADGMITELHKDEKVLSAPFSRRLDQLMSNVELMQAPAASMPVIGPPRLKDPANFNAQPMPVAERLAMAVGGGAGRDGDIHIHALDAASVNNLMRRPGIARNTVDVMRSQAGQGNFIKKGK
ncbi:MAG: phage tail length tape measure family protein [Magnetospirillum sp.]|nr:phage tail length tape measure family protein [Magnetospirillum sp.]